MAAIDSGIEQFENFLGSKSLLQPPHTYLVLEHSVHDGVCWWGYYYASSKTRSLFWLEKYVISHHINQVEGDILTSHISETGRVVQVLLWLIISTLARIISGIPILAGVALVFAWYITQLLLGIIGNYSQILRSISQQLRCLTWQRTRYLRLGQAIFKFLKLSVL